MSGGHWPHRPSYVDIQYNVEPTCSDSAENFHWAAITHWACSRNLSAQSSGSMAKLGYTRYPPEAEAVCRHCIQILTAQTIKTESIYYYYSSGSCPWTSVRAAHVHSDVRYTTYYTMQTKPCRLGGCMCLYNSMMFSATNGLWWELRGLKPTHMML